MDKHTPAPWQYSFEGGTVAFIVEADGTTVAKLTTTENSTAHKNLAANTRLIAAAPDLLEALKYFLFAGQNGAVLPRDYAYQKALAAIAKATGYKATGEKT
jgi:hypothetical protein